MKILMDVRFSISEQSQIPAVMNLISDITKDFVVGALQRNETCHFIHPISLNGRYLGNFLMEAFKEEKNEP